MQTTNTRYHDVQTLAAARERAKSPWRKTRLNATLAAVYEMSKDPTLEAMRRQLIDAIKWNNHKKMFEIKQKIEAYVSTESFRKRVASAVVRATNIREANRFYYRKI